MKKYDMNGKIYIKIDNMYDILRNVRNADLYENTAAVIDSIIRMMMYDELKTADETTKSVILGIPGDFIICKRIPDLKTIVYFQELSRGKVNAVADPKQAMHFVSENMARKIAEVAGEGWHVVSVGEEDLAITKRLLAELME